MEDPTDHRAAGERRRRAAAVWIAGAMLVLALVYIIQSLRASGL